MGGGGGGATKVDADDRGRLPTDGPEDDRDDDADDDADDGVDMMVFGCRDVCSSSVQVRLWKKKSH